MPFDGVTRWQIDILAADKTAQAFATVDRRLKAMEVAQRAASAGLNAGFGLVTRTLGPLSAALSAAAIAQRVWNAGMEAANMGEQAEQIGLTTDALQAYRLAAAQNGVEAAQLDASMMRLTRTMGEAAGGSDDAIARFESLGVNLLDNSGKLRRTADILPEVAAGLLEMGNQAQRDELMMQIFGRSGARMITMLETLAQGQDKVVASAREMNAIMSGSVIGAWDKLDDRLKVVNQQMTTLLGTVGAPIATAGLDMINFELAKMVGYLRLAEKGWGWLTNKAGTSLEGMQTEAAQVQARIDKLSSQSRTTLSEAELQREYARLGVLQRRIAEEQTAAYMPTITVEAPKLGVANPAGKQASAAGAKLDERLKDLQVERAALERALSAFDVRGLESVAEIDKRIDAQVKLDQKIASVLKDVPPNSPLAGQLIQEATAVSQLNTRLDERKQLLSEAERITEQFGDGAQIAARESDRLNQMMAIGAIDGGAYALAMRDINQRAEDRARAVRGLAGGFDGFRAGIEQYNAEMLRANTTFEMGKFAAQEFGSVFTGVNQGLREGKDLLQSLGDVGVNALGRIADKAIDMAAQNLIGAALGGLGGNSGGGLFGSLLGGITGLFGGGTSGAAVGGGTGGGYGTYADGAAFIDGRVTAFAAGGIVNRPTMFPMANGAGLMGEAGPEAILPLSRGAGGRLGVLAQGGGAPTVVVPVTVHNYGNDQVRTEQSTGPDGMPRIEVFVEAIDGAMAKRLDRGVGATSEVLKGRYGLQPVGRR